MGTSDTGGRIVQFGTSRFLQAHVALFAHEARLSGQPVGPVTVVQCSGSVERAGRVDAFGQPYPVVIRGMVDGIPVERTVEVDIVDRGLSAARDWEVLISIFEGRLAAVVSNTGDRGYEVPDTDRTPALLDGTVPTSFPGKLTALLHRRWRADAGPLTMLPCELLPHNGSTLRSLVRDLARDAGGEPAFVEWLGTDVVWADTLVDRIVSEALEPIGAVAEPYAIWAVERRPGLRMPFTHPDVVVVDDLEAHERLKLHILNLGHTVLAQRWLDAGSPAGVTVRALLDGEEVRRELEDLYEREVVPGFAARGMERQARAYVATTMDRFRNPFLDHKLADIAQNHGAKVERRIAAFLTWAARGLATPRLDGLVARHAEDRAA